LPAGHYLRPVNQPFRFILVFKKKYPQRPGRRQELFFKETPPTKGQNRRARLPWGFAAARRHQTHRLGLSIRNAACQSVSKPRFLLSLPGSKDGPAGMTSSKRGKVLRRLPAHLRAIHRSLDDPWPVRRPSLEWVLNRPVAASVPPRFRAARPRSSPRSIPPSVQGRRRLGIATL